MERRSSVRFRLSLYVELENDTGWTRDVGKTGSCIESVQPFMQGNTSRFYLSLTKGEDKVLCKELVLDRNKSGSLAKGGFYGSNSL